MHVDVDAPDLDADRCGDEILTPKRGNSNLKPLGIPGKHTKDEEIRGIAANKRLTTVLKHGKSGSFFEHVQPAKQPRARPIPADDRRFGRPA